MTSFVLNIARDAGGLKLIWVGSGADESWTPRSYRVNAGLLQQAANDVRKQLRAIALLPERCDADQFAPLLRKLARNGQNLFQQLMPPAGTDGVDADDIRRRLTHALAHPNGHQADLKVVVETNELFVPWGFVFSGSNDDVPDKAVGGIADMKGFWLAQFCISVVYGGATDLPSERVPRSSRLLALHQAMFSGARKELAKDCHECMKRLDELLADEPKPTMDWNEFFEVCDEVQDNHDTVLYLYGHSDGQRIQLSDDDEQEALTAASMWRFRKRTKGTASIFILNGCRTAAPAPSSPEAPISANFVTETRQQGYFGFIGTEAQVSNIFACRYGTEFLWQLFKKGKSVGETFDELLYRSDLFPQNLLYTCYADRKFCLAAQPQKGERP